MTLTAILEEINKSSSSKSNKSIQEEQLHEPGLNETQSSEAELEGNLVINEQSTRDESQGSLLGEMNPELPNDASTKQQEVGTTSNAAVQDIKSSELLIPREEFELIDDPNSLDDIVIYDVVVEYQGIITSTTHMEEDIIEIKMEPTKNNTSVIMLGDSSQTPISNSDALESTTMSQVVIAHEEEVQAQSFGAPSDEELEQWTKVLNNRADDEQWCRDGVHEEDMALVTRDRSDPIPTNNDCISNIYGYEEVDDPAIPTAIYYRYCKPPTSLEEVQRRENFRERRRGYFARPAIKVGHSWFPEIYLPDPEDPEWSWKEGLELEVPAESVYQLNEGKVFWDSFKYLRNRGEHPYYRWYGHENAVNKNSPPNPVTHVQRPLYHGAKFDKRWYPSSEFDGRGQKDLVMYHQLYKGTTAIDLAHGQVLVYNNVFYPPENEEWIIPHSSKQYVESTPKKKNKKKSNSQVETNLLEIKNMKTYVENEEGIKSSTEAEHQPSSNKKWGSLHTKPPKDLNQWQQGYMSRQEVSGEATTSAASAQPTHSSVAYPNYKIPKKSNLESSRLNQLVSNISPPAKEKNEGADEPNYQPHKQNKGRSRGPISSTHQRWGRSKKKSSRS